MKRESQTHLIVMTRLPRAGFTKTRLIPALGPEGASLFHDRLARHAIGRASAYCMQSGSQLTVCIAGGTPIDAKMWLQDDGLDCREQASGDLGKRMQSAVENAFEKGAGRVLIIGTDCPSIDASVFENATSMLSENDLVYGPAIDGGYYLIGLRNPTATVFTGISWGSAKVLEESLAAAKHQGLKVGLLDPLFDVDLPADLPAAEKSLEKGNTVSVIIPVFNEASEISKVIQSVSESSPHEIIVVDGGSEDQTRAIAEQAGATLISAPKGRASQMNQGAVRATGDFLLFLHADTIPPKDFPEIIAHILKRPNTAAGAFRFKLDRELGASALIESLVDLRCRYLGLPYGDQGIFVRRTLFESLGGFPDWPAMEDLHFIRQMGKLGRIRISDDCAVTSGRRWEKGGLVRTFFRHQLMFASYWIARLFRRSPKLTRE